MQTQFRKNIEEVVEVCSTPVTPKAMPPLSAPPSQLHSSSMMQSPLLAPDAIGEPDEEGGGEHEGVLGGGRAHDEAGPAGRVAAHHGVEERERVLRGVSHPELWDWVPGPGAAPRLHCARLVTSFLHHSATFSMLYIIYSDT